MASTEARLIQLLDRATALASQAEAERGQLQRVLEEFALERVIYDDPPRPPPGGAGPLIDVDALRRGAQELAEDLTRSSALRGNLTTTLQLIRSCRDQFVPDRAFQAVENTNDVKLQHAMNAAREDERRRLAREVHDGPAQVLANAIFAIDLTTQIAKRMPEQVIDELARVRSLLKDGVAEIRRFMFDLRPTMLEDQGLAPTLRHFVGEYSRFFGMHVELTVDDPLPALSREEDLALFRIVQEGLQNVRKHAEVDKASIALQDLRHGLILTIRDTGKGFDPATNVSRPGSGAGLSGIKERARLIGADFTVESGAGAGATLIVHLPRRTSTEL